MSGASAPSKPNPSVTIIPAAKARGPVTWRSLLLGTVGVLFICILTPFNDYVLKNTSVVGSALPAGLMLFFFLFLTLINAPIRRWFPNRALNASELATALGMAMVSCAIPGNALMKYTPAHLVGIWQNAAQHGTFQRLLDDAHLPNWMFPTTARNDTLGRANDPVMVNYIGRVQVKEDTFTAHFRAVPWKAWRAPAISWGILFGCIFGVAICMACVVHRQWSEVERLPFPLASLYSSLIEPPEPGRGFNQLFSSPVFWIGFIGVFGAHSINALHAYYPLGWPEIPLHYDIQGLTTEYPWKYLDPDVTKNAICFSVVGLTYFMQQRLAFSIWACMLLLTIPRMLTQYTGTYFPGDGQMADEMIGALVPYLLMMAWVGRAEWAMVVRRMVGRFRADDPQGRYLPFGVAGWGVVLFTVGISVWLMMVGTGWMGTAMLVFFLLTMLLLLMRVVAETGIVMLQFIIWMYRPWHYTFRLFPSVATNPITVKRFFLTGFFNVLFTVGQREPISVFASQTLRTEDLAGEGKPWSIWRGIAVVLALCGALTVGYVSAGGSLLYFEYKYANTLDNPSESPVNKYGVGESAAYALRDASEFADMKSAPPQEFSTPTHLAIGAGITAFLSVMALRFTWWPIHPLGYLLTFSWPTWFIWYSVMIGWLAKWIILRLGGVKLFRSAKPLFIGLIMGECGAVGFWLCISLIRLAMGLDYHAINVFAWPLS